MFQPSTDYKLIDPMGIVRHQASAKIIRRMRKQNGKGWTIGYSSRKYEIGQPFSTTPTNESETTTMAKNTNKSTEPQTAKTILMVKEKDCKHVIRYKASDNDALCDNIYLSKRFAEPMPQAIRLTIEPM